jgi:hypothetical protein
MCAVPLLAWAGYRLCCCIVEVLRGRLDQAGYNLRIPVFVCDPSIRGLQRTREHQAGLCPQPKRGALGRAEAERESRKDAST